MKKNLSGNSFVEVIVILLIIGALTAVAVPRLSFSAVFIKTAETTAGKLITDLRRTRRLAIANAASNSKGYELKLTGPVPYSSYQIKNLDTSETVDTHEINENIDCTGESNFKFGPLGNLLNASESKIGLSANGKTFTITVTPATGMVKCVENQ